MLEKAKTLLESALRKIGAPASAIDLFNDENIVADPRDPSIPLLATPDGYAKISADSVKRLLPADMMPDSKSTPEAELARLQRKVDKQRGVVADAKRKVHRSGGSSQSIVAWKKANSELEKLEKELDIVRGDEPAPEAPLKKGTPEWHAAIEAAEARVEDTLAIAQKDPRNDNKMLEYNRAKRDLRKLQNQAKS